MTSKPFIAEIPVTEHLNDRLGCRGHRPFSIRGVLVPFWAARSLEMEPLRESIHCAVRTLETPTSPYPVLGSASPTILCGDSIKRVVLHCRGASMGLFPVGASSPRNRPLCSGIWETANDSWVGISRRPRPAQGEWYVRDESGYMANCSSRLQD